MICNHRSCDCDNLCALATGHYKGKNGGHKMQEALLDTVTVGTMDL